MISRLISVYRSVAQAGRTLRDWLVRTFLGPRFAKIAVEFFTEAAVLVAVFPVLDTIIENGGLLNVTWPLVAWSEGLAVLFLFLAGIISMGIGE
jgi:hypothetical protein